jgi:hypothetical protein
MAGYREEANGWREWSLRATAGDAVAILLGNFRRALARPAVIDAQFNLTGDAFSPAQHRRSREPR